MIAQDGGRRGDRSPGYAFISEGEPASAGGRKPPATKSPTRATEARVGHPMLADVKVLVDRMGHPRSVSRSTKLQELVEVGKQSTNQVEGLPNNHNQGFTFANPMFIERYLKRELYILVHFRVRRIGEEMLALFHKQCLSATDPPISGVSEKASDSVSGSQMLADIKLPYRRSSSQQQAMFVSDIEIMESPKMSVPSLVWFGLLNDIDRFLPHSLYLSSKRGLLLLGRRDVFENGEASKFIGRSAFCSDQSIGQIVERTSDVLEDVTSDEQDFRRDGRNLGSIVDMLSGIRISLFADRVGVSGNELIESGMQIVCCACRPTRSLGENRPCQNAKQYGDVISRDTNHG